jgi:hypothetical protein
MTAQQWETTPQVERVAGVRRSVVAYTADEGVVGAVLADLAIGVSAVLANVVRSRRHVGGAASLSVSVDIDERVLVRVRGPHVQTARLDNRGAALGLVTAASVASDIRVCSPTSTGPIYRCVSPARRRRAVRCRRPCPSHGRLTSAARESV